MTKLFTIQDSLENKISYYFVAVFLILMPFDRFYSEVVVITFLFHTLFHIKRQNLQRIFRWENLLLTSVFLVNIVGMAWSHDRSEALKDMEYQLAIILFPIILSLTNLDLARYKKNLLTIFGLTCVITLLYLFADAVHVIWYNGLPPRSLLSSVFVNHNFSAPIGMHATYLSMYIAIALTSFFSFLSGEKSKMTRFFYILGIVVLLVGLLQLAAKSVVMATVILIIPFFFLMPKSSRKLRFILIPLVVAGVTLFVATRVGSFKSRYLTELKGDLTEASLNNEILEPRIVRWRSAIPLVKQSLLIGYGSGSEKRLLKDTYFENKLYDSYLHELNAHNQYLSFLIKTGLIGLLIFLCTLYLGFVVAWRSRDVIFTSFMILITVVSFSENILDVNKGIFFYAFFFSFFLKTSKPFDQLFRFAGRKKPSNT